MTIRVCLSPWLRDTVLRSRMRLENIVGKVMMCTSCMLRELQVFKIIIIYTFFIWFINNKKLEEGDDADNYVYILHV
jgi:hypothetical protein